ncbi:hypothetical protein MRB53_002358 [Persea americana]|uniref:Uncharacterized protein n=1 Tax=Persea americana TaxID=3435 RepID=A0ACC2MUI7_PERAE|nr:hypothetical protein MRB53_002358 [Persea americana]
MLDNVRGTRIHQFLGFQSHKPRVTSYRCWVQVYWLKGPQTKPFRCQWLDLKVDNRLGTDWERVGQSNGRPVIGCSKLSKVVVSRKPGKRLRERKQSTERS